MQKKEIRVFFFGDSICFGQGVSLHKTWVSKISETITSMKVDSKADYLFANLGVNGNTTRLALERMPYDVQSHKPHVVIVQFGLNDCNYWDSDGGVPRVSKEAFVANINEIVERCFVHGALKVILNSNHPTLLPKKLPTDRVTYDQSNQEYSTLIRKVGVDLYEKYGQRFKFIDIKEFFDSRLSEGIELSSLLLEDGLHLSESGHELYFERIKPAVEEVLHEIKI